MTTKDERSRFYKYFEYRKQTSPNQCADPDEH
jgi:hypothetical protein